VESYVVTWHWRHSGGRPSLHQKAQEKTQINANHLYF